MIFSECGIENKQVINSSACRHVHLLLLLLERTLSSLLDLLLCVLLHLSLSISLALRSSLGVQEEVPPSETRCVGANEEVVVLVVVVCTGPEWDKVVQRPWELVSGVSIHGLEQSQADPERNSEQMQVSGEVAPQKRNTHGTGA